MITAPCCSRRRAIVLLPEPTPPLSATRMSPNVPTTRKAPGTNRPGRLGRVCLPTGELLAECSERLVRSERTARLRVLRGVGRRIARLGRGVRVGLLRVRELLL